MMSGFETTGIILTSRQTHSVQHFSIVPGGGGVADMTCAPQTNAGLRMSEETCTTSGSAPCLLCNSCTTTMAEAPPPPTGGSGSRLILEPLAVPPCTRAQAHAEAYLIGSRSISKSSAARRRRGSGRGPGSRTPPGTAQGAAWRSSRGTPSAGGRRRT